MIGVLGENLGECNIYNSVLTITSTAAPPTAVLSLSQVLGYSGLVGNEG
jgi:hypothetical protein